MKRGAGRFFPMGLDALSLRPLSLLNANETTGAKSKNHRAATKLRSQVSHPCAVDNHGLLDCVTASFNASEDLFLQGCEDTALDHRGFIIPIDDVGSPTLQIVETRQEWSIPLGHVAN